MSGEWLQYTRCQEQRAEYKGCLGRKYRLSREKVEYSVSWDKSQNMQGVIKTGRIYRVSRDYSKNIQGEKKVEYIGCHEKRIYSYHSNMPNIQSITRICVMFAEAHNHADWFNIISWISCIFKFFLLWISAELQILQVYCF